MRVCVVFDGRRNMPRSVRQRAAIASNLLTLKEAQDVINALRDLGHSVGNYDSSGKVLRHLSRIRNQFDVVFNLASGVAGPDRKGLVPILLDHVHVPYTGSSAFVHGLVRHKHVATKLVQAYGIRAPDSMLVTRENVDECIGLAPLPAIAKPCFESASAGISSDSRMISRSALRKRTETLLKEFRQPVVIESFVDGREVSVAVVGAGRPRVFGAVELLMPDGSVPGKRPLDFDLVKNYSYSMRAPAQEISMRRIEDAAILAYKVLGIRDYGRVDFRVDEEGRPTFLEASTHPHIFRTSEFAFIAESQGLPYREVVRTILSEARGRIESNQA